MVGRRLTLSYRARQASANARYCFNSLFSRLRAVESAEFRLHLAYSSAQAVESACFLRKHSLVMPIMLAARGPQPQGQGAAFIVVRPPRFVGVDALAILHASASVALPGCGAA